jgi:hypothetical protein
MTTTDLGEFEGHPVLSSAFELPRAGGGLNAAIGIDNLLLHHGDEGYLVIHYGTAKVRFDPIKDTDGVQRVHTLNLLMAAQIDGDYVQDALEKQRIRVEEASGVTRIPYPDPDGADEPGDTPSDSNG